MSLDAYELNLNPQLTTVWLILWLGSDATDKMIKESKGIKESRQGIKPNFYPNIEMLSIWLYTISVHCLALSLHMATLASLQNLESSHQTISEAYSEPSQISKLKGFAKTVNVIFDMVLNKRLSIFNNTWEDPS